MTDYTDAVVTALVAAIETAVAADADIDDSKVVVTHDWPERFADKKNHVAVSIDDASIIEEAFAPQHTSGNLYRIGRWRFDVVVDVIALKRDTATDLSRCVRDALRNSGTQTSALVLELADYHDVLARFVVRGGVRTYGDGPIGGRWQRGFSVRCSGDVITEVVVLTLVQAILINETTGSELVLEPD